MDTLWLPIPICCASVQQLPVFHKILDIITLNRKTMFITEIYSTDYFCETRQAFAILATDEKTLVLLSSLKYKEPFDAVLDYTADDSIFYIVPKYVFLD